MIRFSLRLPDNVHRRVKLLAERERRSINDQIVRMLETHPDVEAMAMPTEATTYTIVCHRESGALLACVPDSEDWREAVRREMEAIGEDMPADHEIEVHSGCVLADEYDDYDRVVYVGGLTTGTLSDVAGRPYKYAIRP